MRGSTGYALLTVIGMAVMFFLLCIHPLFHRANVERARALRRAMVADLGITDLCLFTEAPYTRNPAVTDGHAPFQNHPLALEHMPSGIFIRPSHRLSRPANALD
ncbi:MULTISPECIES: hypothetical protein [Desulfococcus]|nr:hypothetical protein [Desulfococcus multivorans]AOY59306.1 conserved uncharacterized protein [Desulfococcus multivorans]AQV01526.2 hypothetical protein B2D07_12685 [Desulfococcus multivorans]